VQQTGTNTSLGRNCAGKYVPTFNVALNRIYRVSQDLRSLLRDLIPELTLSQKRHIHMGPICNGSGVMSF